MAEMHVDDLARVLGAVRAAVHELRALDLAVAAVRATTIGAIRELDAGDALARKRLLARRRRSVAAGCRSRPSPSPSAATAGSL